MPSCAPSLRRSIFAASIVAYSFNTPLSGAVTVYEGFDTYFTGFPIQGRDGGIGFASTWDSRSSLIGGGSGSAAGTILEDSLSYSDGVRTLVTQGGSLFISGASGNVEVARQIAPDALSEAALEADTFGTSYISFLAQRSGDAADPEDPVYGGDYPHGDNLYPRAAGVNLYSVDGEDVLDMLIGNNSNQHTDVWRVVGEDLYADERRDARSRVPFGEGNTTRFIVIRIDHGGGGWHGDRLRMWIDPVLASENANQPPMVFDWTVRDDPKQMQPAFIGIQAGNASSNRPHAEFTFDEFRIGESWADVTPHTGGDDWTGFPVLENAQVMSGDRYLGWLALTDSPWAYSWSLNGWVYIPAETHSENGAWVFLNQ